MLQIPKRRHIAAAEFLDFNAGRWSQIGKPGRSPRTLERDPPEERWSAIIERHRRGGATGWHAGCVEFRWFKNGGLHVWLQDEALIDAINEVIAQHYGATLAGRRG